MKKLNVGDYTIAVYKRQPVIQQDVGPTKVEVIAGERPPHWVIRLIRGGYKWDFPDYKSVIPMTNQQALGAVEDMLLKLALHDDEHAKMAIYMLAGMYPTNGHRAASDRSET